jgi:ribosomal protein S18 acetylase RimI-like enzyme
MCAVIKPIAESDIAACAALIRTSFGTVADTFGFTAENAPRFTAFAVTEETLLRQFAEKRRWMIAYYLDNGVIAGYYSLLLQKHSVCELNHLCVLPPLRQQGVGGALLRDAFQRARNADCKTMKISIVEENAPLKQWYVKNGFVHLGTKKFEFFPFTCGYMEKML